MCSLHTSTGILQACQINGNTWVLCTASSLQLWVLDEEHQLNLSCREDLHGCVLKIWPFPDDSLAVLASSAGTVDLHVFRVTDCFHLQPSPWAMPLVGDPLVESFAVDVLPWQDAGNHPGCILSAHTALSGILVSSLQTDRHGRQKYWYRCFQEFKASESWKHATSSLKAWLTQLSCLYMQTSCVCRVVSSQQVVPCSQTPLAGINPQLLAANPPVGGLPQHCILWRPAIVIMHPVMLPAVWWPSTSGFTHPVF